MKKLETLIIALHDLLLKDKKINDVYDMKDENISSEIVPMNDLDVDQLRTNFFGTITYLFKNYCLNTEYAGGEESDIIEKICELFKLLSENYNLILSIDVLLVLKTYMLLMFYSITAQKKYCLDKVIDKNLKLEKCLQNKKVYFRGEDNFAYNLIPSFYRKSLADFKDDITIIDDDFLKRVYYENGMLSEYKKIFGSRYGYGFLAFMQHTFAFSPFLDFTSSHIIGLSFSSTNADKENDGSFYVLDTRNDVSKYRNKDKRFVIYSKRKLNILDKIDNKSLYNCSYRDFESMIRLCKNQPNDRMKYQKGIFMDIYSCIIVRGVLLLPVGNEMLTKYRIPLHKAGYNKKAIATKVRKMYPQYKYRSLMNPYRYFEKWKNKKR